MGLVKPSIIYTVFVLVILFGILGIYLHCRFVSLLRDKYPEKWKALGSPALLTNNSIKNNIAIMSFLKNKEYLSIGDQELNRISKLLWNFGCIYVLFFIITIVLFLLFIVK